MKRDSLVVAGFQGFCLFAGMLVQIVAGGHGAGTTLMILVWYVPKVFTDGISSGIARLGLLASAATICFIVSCFGHPRWRALATALTAAFAIATYVQAARVTDARFWPLTLATGTPILFSAALGLARAVILLRRSVTAPSADDAIERRPPA